MATDPEALVVRNLVALQRLANGMADEVVRADLEPLFNEIIAQIARLDPGGDAARALRESRIADIMDGVESLSDEAFARVLTRVRGRLEALGVQQGQWAADLLTASVGEDVVRATGLTISREATSPQFIRTIIEENPFGDPAKGGGEKLLAEWADTQKRATVRRVRQQLQLGMANGETLGDIVRRTRGTQRGGRFVGGVLEATTRETEAIVRTAINHVSSASHMRTYEANEDIVTGIESVGVIDSRTTILCASLDGVVWPIGSPDIVETPRHFQCRTVLMPRIGWEELGIESPESGQRPAKTYDAESGQLQETGAEQVSASTSYEQWFKRQPAAVQDQIIGPTRARLFRSDKVSFKDMITRDGRRIAVKDLPGGEDALKAVRGG